MNNLHRIGANRNKLLRRLTAIIPFAMLLAAQHVSAQVDFAWLHTFTAGECSNGATTLIRGTDGNFYGTCQAGGTSSNGSVFRMTPDGTVTVLHSFAIHPDGYYPYGSLVEGADGFLYGTTWGGDGTIYRVSRDGSVFQTVHAFARVDGVAPTAGMIIGADGNFYGTTLNTVFELAPDGSMLATLHAFDPDRDGAPVYTPVLQGTDGAFYGTAAEGGGPWKGIGAGTVYRVTGDGTFVVLHAFSGQKDGAFPFALIQGSDGQLYGATYLGGVETCGTIFRLGLDGSHFTVLYTGVVRNNSCAPTSFMQASDGNFYGPAAGSQIVEMTADGSVTAPVYSSASSLGSLWTSPLLQAPDGYLYGVSGFGIYRMSLPIPDLSLGSLGVPAVSGAGTTITVHDTTKNSSSAPVRSSVTYFYLSSTPDGSGLLVGSRSVKGLKAGTSFSGSTSVTIPSDTPTGTYWIIAKADGPDQVHESDEGNNTLAKKIAIGPNLKLAAVTAPSTAVRGTTITIGDTTLNAGGGSDDVSTSTRFYLSTTSTGLTRALGQRTIPTLGAAGSSTGTTTVTIPADVAPGAYFIVAHADDANALAETSEGDNKRSARITITR
jgi:uncharacterized repeat protein (TIGR03803 family)